MLEEERYFAEVTRDSISVVGSTRGKQGKKSALSNAKKAFIIIIFSLMK